MSLLRRWLRDPEIPSAAGDDLRVLDERGLIELLARTLVRPETPAIARTELVTVRWKPRVSLTSLHTVHFSDETETLVTVKTYLGEKARHVSRFHTLDERLRGQSGSLEPLAVIEETGTCVWSFPADRRLRGLSRVLEPRRTARWIDESAIFRPYVVRLRPSTIVLRRYKPERRAVLQMNAKLRGPQGAREVRQVGLRVLPVKRAAQVIETRWQLQNAAPGLPIPPLFAWEAKTGVLLEPWFPGVAVAPDDYSHAHTTGALVARLHAIPSIRQRALERPSVNTLDVLLVHPGLADMYRPDPAPLPACGWTHGDLHADQVLLGDAPILLDLDEARPGHPAEDLASFLADALTEDGEAAWPATVAALLEGHRSAGGPPVDETLLRAEIARHLVQRAAAGIRRLESGALDKARRLLERAREIEAETKGLA